MLKEILLVLSLISVSSSTTYSPWHLRNFDYSVSDICSYTYDNFKYVKPCQANYMCQTVGGDNHAIETCRQVYKTVKIYGEACSGDIECDSGLKCEGSKCIKNGSEVVSVNAKEEKTNVTSTDTKNAKAVVTSNSEKVSAKESTTTSYDTINANVSNKLTDKVLIKTQKVTADTIYSYDVKGAIGKETTTYVTYSSYTSYDIITATKYATTSGWEYVSTLYTYDGNKAFVGENEKLVLYSSESVPACDGCGSTVIMYKYFRYKKVTGGYTYSCDKFPGYSLYDGDKCRKAVSTKKCPDGYKDT